jgi:tetrahydromethanopterin S-methyltransferase subunit F
VAINNLISQYSEREKGFIFGFFSSMVLILIIMAVCHVP